MLYPLKFEPVYKDFIWGGRELEKLGKKIPEGTVAESWEISSHTDGEGTVINGHYRGLTLNELIHRIGKELTGLALSEKAVEKFPLFIKLIDANDRLSVQVHPDDDYAGIHENGGYGKNEMWHILSAKPGARIVYGVNPGIDRASFEATLKEDNIDSCLNYMEVSSGDTVNIPAGLVHSIGSGIVLAEIQQDSNITYRVFDYNRLDKNGIKRPLHIKKALDVINFNNCSAKGKIKGLKVEIGKNSTKYVLLANQYYCIEKLNIGGFVKKSADGSRFLIYTCLEGKGQIHYSTGSVELSKGESVLIPANLGEYSIEGNLQLLKASVPDIEKDVVAPLVKAGYTVKEIFEKVIV